MKLLLKAALLNRKHYALLFITVIALFFMTVASQMEMFSLGVMTKAGPDAFALFGSSKSETLSLNDVENKWVEIAGSKKALITKEEASAYIASQKGGNLVQKVTAFLDSHFQISKNLGRLALILVFVAIFKAGALFANRYCTHLVAIRVSRDLRQSYFEHIQTLPMSFYQEHNIGGLASRITGDAGVVASAINSMLINYIQTPFALISTAIACFYISWKLSLIIFIGFPLVVWPMVFIAKKIKAIARQMQKSGESFASALIEYLSGILTVKVFAMEEFSLKKYKEQNHRMARLEEKSAKYGLSSRPILHTVSSLFFAAVILSGLYLFQMGASELLVFCGLLYVFYEPIKKFAEENHQIQRGVAAAERMYEVLSLKPPIEDKPGAIEWKGFLEGMEFRNVSFRYEKEWVLRNLSFSVKKGESVAIVGPTGSGKSTIVQLLPRLYEIQEGEILIDGRSIKEYTQRSLREGIAFVPQKPFLFLDSVRENIAFGRPFSDEEVEEAARNAQAEEFIVRLPERYGALIAESGKNLSGGQQQRLAIARALVKKAPILILDEATSSLDALSEKGIKETMESLRGKVTQIIIAHRLSTIEHVDRIIYLERGCKVAEGTREQLLESCPQFRKVWEMMHQSD